MFCYSSPYIARDFRLVESQRPVQANRMKHAPLQGQDLIFTVRIAHFTQGNAGIFNAPIFLSGAQRARCVYFLFGAPGGGRGFGNQPGVFVVLFIAEFLIFRLYLLILGRFFDPGKSALLRHGSVYCCCHDPQAKENNEHNCYDRQVRGEELGKEPNRYFFCGCLKHTSKIQKNTPKKNNPGFSGVKKLQFVGDITCALFRLLRLSLSVSTCLLKPLRSRVKTFAPRL